MKKFIELLESLPATLIGGALLLVSLFLPMMIGKDIPLFLDPAWIALVISGLPIVCSAIKKLIKNKGISKISSSLLISTAMIAAAAIGDIFAAGEVAFIMAIGEFLEDKTTSRAKKGLKKLISLAPTVARRIENGKEITVSAQDIRVGDIIRVLPGETIAADGTVIKGESSVDQSVMTGESLPVDKTEGDSVFCGTINRFGAIDIRVTKAGEDSSLHKLIKMVKEAQSKKAPVQRIADRWASLLVPVALVIAVIAGIVKQDIVTAVTVLVVFCPCALVLTTPTAIMAAIGQATKHGVIIKSGEALEAMGKVDTVALDKTGTLTYGKLEVSDVISFADDINKDELLSLAASAESKSEHPLARAIVEHARSSNISAIESEDFRMEAGKGISATVSGRAVLCGNEKYIGEKGVQLSEKIKSELDSLRNQGKASLLVAIDADIVGIIALSDTLRPTAKDMVTRLDSMNTATVLLTGDNRQTAEHFAARVGIAEIRAELLPEEKVASIVSIQNSGGTVCMIGDGVNDAPALKTANVGIAMGTMGSDIAIDAADIALMNDDISKIPYLKKLSVATLRTIKLGIFLSMFINFAAILLSFFGILNPTTGALVHNAGSLFVILIAALLYDRKFD